MVVMIQKSSGRFEMIEGNDWNDSSYRNDFIEDVPVQFYKNIDVIAAEGVEIHKVSATAIARKRPISNSIIQEQLVVDVDNILAKKLASPLVLDILNKLPLVQANINVFTLRGKLDNIPEGIMVSEINMIEMGEISSFAIGYDLLTNKEKDNLKKLLNSTKDGGFILSREQRNTSWNRFYKNSNYLQASLRCLAHRGGFLDTGNFDFAANNQLSNRTFVKSISIQDVLLDQIMKTNDENEICSIFNKLIRENVIKLIIRTAFDKDQVEKVFRFMANGKHVGKILIKIHQESEPLNTRILAELSYVCIPIKSYIILSGLGSFGLDLVDWLILRNAQNIIISSRNGIKYGYQHMRIKLWKLYDVNMNILSPVDGIFKLLDLNFAKLMEKNNKPTDDSNLNETETNQILSITNMLRQFYDEILATEIAVPFKTNSVEGWDEMFFLPGIEGYADVFKTLESKIKSPATCFQFETKYELKTVEAMVNSILLITEGKVDVQIVEGNRITVLRAAEISMAINGEPFENTTLFNEYQAHMMNSITRMMFEHTYEATIDADIIPEDNRGTRTGVFTATLRANPFKFGWIKSNLGYTKLANGDSSIAKINIVCNLILEANGNVFSSLSKLGSEDIPKDVTIIGSHMTETGETLIHGGFLLLPEERNTSLHTLILQEFQLSRVLEKRPFEDFSALYINGEMQKEPSENVSDHMVCNSGAWESNPT
ncbi:hypothetical protein HZH68_004065 [Vespula germanica]|uniref:Enoyl reductase (ER) domain-containing protein n=1 Tax=Vespula germanica TaxID=30212 RepID=A0A834NJ26_VESGE|nr:hypothetical protein HZH68_004065 [Vespula germanica]